MRELGFVVLGTAWLLIMATFTSGQNPKPSVFATAPHPFSKYKAAALPAAELPTTIKQSAN